MGCTGVHGDTWVCMGVGGSNWGGCRSVHAGVDWGSSLRLQEMEALCES